jgi:hypothetical protein
MTSIFNRKHMNHISKNMKDSLEKEIRKLKKVKFWFQSLAFLFFQLKLFFQDVEDVRFFKVLVTLSFSIYSDWWKRSWMKLLRSFLGIRIFLPVKASLIHNNFLKSCFKSSEPDVSDSRWSMSRSQDLPNTNLHTSNKNENLSQFFLIEHKDNEFMARRFCYPFQSFNPVNTTIFRTIYSVIFLEFSFLEPFLY